MPNWCYTSVKCTGNTDEIQNLYDRMKRLQEMKEPLKPNGFGTTWLGNLVEDLGVDFNKVQCRGSWDCLEMDDDTYYLMESEALQTLSDFFGIDFKDMDEAMILVRENNDKDDGRVWVNRYEFV